MKNITILILTAVLVAGCSATAGGNSLPVPSRWNLVSFGPVGTETPVVPGSSVTLEFGPDGRAGGSAGCNSYGGDVEIRGQTLDFSELVRTLMACEDTAVMEQEDLFLAALQSSDRWEMSGASLTLSYNGGQGRLSFTRLD